MLGLCNLQHHGRAAAACHCQGPLDCAPAPGGEVEPNQWELGLQKLEGGLVPSCGVGVLWGTVWVTDIVWNS